MKNCFIFLLILTTVLSAKSLGPSAPSGIALVLEGGGAKGIAHVGFLMALEENDVRISALAGTSMGALMAGLYSCGYSAAQLDSLCRAIDWNHLFNSAPESRLTFLPDRVRGRQDLVSLNIRGLTPSLPQSAVSNMRVGFLLSGLTGPIQVMKGFSFDSLRIPLRVVASDLISRDRVIFRKGKLYRFLLASMAIPGVFPPMEEDSLLLVDGGIFDNLPVDAAVKSWADLPVLAVSLDTVSAVEYPESPSLLTVAGMTYEALSDRANEHYYREPDWLIHLDLHEAQVWSFDHADSLLNWGYQQGMAWIAEHPELPRGTTTPVTGWDPPALTIRNILYSGNERVSVLAIDNWLTLNPGDTLNCRTASEAAENLYASGLFSMVRFTMLPTGETGTADLAFDLTEKDPGNIGLGLSYNNDFGLDGRITINHYNTFNRGIRSLVNVGGGNGYAFAELNSYTGTSRNNRFASLSASIYQIKGQEPRETEESEPRIWTDHSISMNADRPFSWFGFSEFSAGIKGRKYAGTGSTSSFPFLAVSFLSDTRDNPTANAPGTRLFLRCEWCPAEKSRHYSANWDFARRSELSGELHGGIYTWGSLFWGDNYSWQESRLTAARGIPGYRWNALPARERIAGGITLSHSLTGPVFLQAEAAGTYDFDTFSQYDNGNISWGIGLSAGVNIPGGTATLGPGFTEEGKTRWTFSYGSDYSFGPGR